MRAGYRIVIAFAAVGWFAIYGGEALAAPESLPDVYPKVNIEYKAENLADPFIDYKTEQTQEASERPKELKPLPPLEVKGMIWGGSFSQAIINNKILKIGESVEGVRITEISKNGIVVLFDNQLYKLASPASINYGNLNKIPEVNLNKSPEGGKK